MKNKEECKKIVFLIGSMGRGGAERVISVLANNYAKKGWKIDILTLLEDKVEYLLDENVKVIPICNKNESRIRQIPNWIFNIRSYMKKNNPERVISFVARINLITIISCIGLNKYIVISERNDPTLDGRSILIKYATNFLYPLAKRIVFQTEWAKSCFSKKIQKKSVIIANPIEVKAYRAKKYEDKIVAVGRLTEQKNHKLLINSFKKVQLKYPNYKLYIYGEGRLKKELENQIKLLELNNSVFLPGATSDIHNKIADAEIFVHSSNYEGLSNALLEAMMIGIPCISTNCSGISEIINSNINGLLVPVNDEVALYNAIIKLIEDKNLAEIISRNSFESSKKFRSEVIFKNWEKCILGEY